MLCSKNHTLSEAIPIKNDSEAIPIKNDSCKQGGSKPAPKEQQHNVLYDRKQNLHPCNAKKAMKVGWEGGYAT